MKKYLITIGLLIILFFILNQCTKYKENPVGSEFFQRENYGSETYAIFQPSPTDTSYKTSVFTDKSGYLYVGGYRANFSRSLIHFSITDIADTITIDSAIVTLYINNILGSASEPFIPTIHPITGAWEPSETNWDNFETANIMGDALTLTETTADTDSVVFTLPPSLIQAWIDTTDQTENNGILISYTALDTGTLLQYYSTNSYEEVYPKLTLFYQEDTLITKDINPSKDTYISTLQKEPGSDYLFIANSVAFRSLIAFDIDTIPQNATINNASLILHADTSLSFPHNSNPFYVYGYAITDITWPTPLVPYDSSLSVAGFLDENSSVLNLNITTLVEGWKYQLLEENAGLILMGVDEPDNILARGFYSTSADSALRPYLEIFYSTPPSSRL
ncbi:DNRLRE domain-containing protein [bacterium]|nr:DNRLRE domain-containing protein [bacterium]RQV95983.1 MAG: DNRLRE domain-containing protein [bacterium]